jgi:hypothetical protein
MGKEVITSPHPIVRNNLVVILTDLCVKASIRTNPIDLLVFFFFLFHELQYPLLSDRYVPTISLCLRDSNELVRKQTLVLLYRLIQGADLEYCCRSALLLTVNRRVREVEGRTVPPLPLCSDRHERDGADLRTLLSRIVVALEEALFPLLPALSGACLLFASLASCAEITSQEALHLLNDYTLNTTYSAAGVSLNLSGPANKPRRMEIYKLMLNLMTQEQKFQVVSPSPCFAYHLQCSVISTDHWENL